MTKKKKILIIVLSIVAAIAIAVGITVGVLLRPKKAPTPGEGVVYQTKEASLWGGYSSAYLEFSYAEEPDEPEEGKTYGYIFKVKAYNNNAWEAWLSGTWEMNIDETELKITASWTDGDNITKLSDATSGEAKTYTLSDGVFKISVDLPSASGTVFTLNPTTDKVGNETPTPPCTNHIDVKNNETQKDGADGKCDICGKDMPSQEVKTTLVTLKAADAQTTMAAEIKMYADSTFDFVLPSMGGKAFDGTWTHTDSENQLSDIKLTVNSSSLPTGYSNPIGDNVLIKITALDATYQSFKYTSKVEYVVPGTISMYFQFVGGYPAGTDVPCVDTNNDGKCDDCGKDVQPSGGECEHIDANHDGTCDKDCGKTDMTVSHTDANHDGTCDVTACGATNLDYTHIDADANGKCDGCEKDMTVERKYSSEEASFWSGVGKANLVLDIATEPANKPATDKTAYGKIFHVIVKGQGTWLTGTWDIEDDTLTLTATFGSGANDTKLSNATSGVAKTYTLADSKYSVAVDLPSAANTVFVINVGGSGNESCKHVDVKNNETQENGADGKCDVCGENMPTKDEKTLLVTLNATDDETTMAAEIKMYADGTFDFVLPSMGGKVFGGNWASTDTTGANPMAPLTLTPDETGKPVVGNTITVNIAPKAVDDYSELVYTCSVTYSVTEPYAITMLFDFTGNFVVPQQPAQKTIQVALNTTDMGGGVINLYTDNTFDFNLTYGGGKIFEGTWKLNTTTQVITLTVDKSTLIGGATESPVGDTMTVTADASGYPTVAYSCSTNYNTGEAEIPMTFTGSLTLS